MLSRLKQWLVSNSYDPAALNPHGLSTRMNFGPESDSLKDKREAMREWMRENNIHPKQAERIVNQD